MAELLFERAQGGENSILVNIQLPQTHDVEYETAEFKLLVSSTGAEILELISGKRHAPEPKYFIGRGKADEIAELVKTTSADLVIFNHELTPAQERNLEKLFECRVLDRTGLILDIFAARAQSHEGKLQVELAQLRHLSSRLVRGWSHLERQKGGIGLRGPGETQLESDRRMISTRIKQINHKLKKVKSTRELGRRARKRANLPTVALVGYTNAGKSSLFTALVASEVYTANQLFATLDTTLRKLKVSSHVDIILADTVGFISKLPHDLIAAFKSTLEETVEADLLLHVIDAASDSKYEQGIEVYSVLKEIGADKIPVIEVMNKIDLLPETKVKLERDEAGTMKRVWLSAEEGLGLDQLKIALDEFFQNEIVHLCLALTPNQGDIRSVLYRKADIISEFYDQLGNCQLELKLEKSCLDSIKFN